MASLSNTNSIQHLVGAANSSGSRSERGDGKDGDFSSILDQAISQSSARSAGSFLGDQGHQGVNNMPLPRHFTTGKDSGNAQPDLQQKMLGVRAYRQQLITSNIANADTPGYLAMDIDIAEAASSETVKPLPMATSTSGHLKGESFGQMQPFQLKYHVPYQASADGNTVEMDVERQKFSENTLMYQFSLDRVGGEFKHMIELFQSLK